MGRRRMLSCLGLLKLASEHLASVSLQAEAAAPGEEGVPSAAVAGVGHIFPANFRFDG